MRLNTIDRCLQQPGSWTRGKLAEACNEAAYESFGWDKDYSIYTIQRDIKMLQNPPPAGYSAPLEWDASINSYRYTEPGYSIHRLPLQQQDIDTIEEALSVLRSIRYLRQQKGLEDLVNRLASSLHFKRQQLQEPALIFSHAQEAPGQEWAGPLYEAALRQHCLQITYQPFEENRQEPVVSPYLLREYNRRWFLIGFSHREGKIRTYAFDRIVDVKRYLLQPYYRDPAFHAEVYFRNIIGVSLPEGGAIETIRLRTTPLRARYIATKPIHPSQKLKEQTSEYTIFELRLIPNIELERLLLSFGEEAVVLQPQWLAQRIARRLQQGAANYGIAF